MYLTFLNIQSRVFTGALILLSTFLLIFLPLFSLALIGLPQFSHASIPIDAHHSHVYVRGRSLEWA